MSLLCMLVVNYLLIMLGLSPIICYMNVEHIPIIIYCHINMWITLLGITILSMLMMLKKSVTRFNICQYNFDLCTCQEKDTVFL